MLLYSCTWGCHGKFNKEHHKRSWVSILALELISWMRQAKTSPAWGGAFRSRWEQLLWDKIFYSIWCTLNESCCSVPKWPCILYLLADANLCYRSPLLSVMNACHPPDSDGVLCSSNSDKCKALWWREVWAVRFFLLAKVDLCFILSSFDNVVNKQVVHLLSAVCLKLIIIFYIFFLSPCSLH